MANAPNRDLTGRHSANISPAILAVTMFIAARVPLVSVAIADEAPPAPDSPQVVRPPESFFELVPERDRETARGFYGKYVDVDGISVAAAPEVDDAALVRTHEIVSHMLAGRPDVRRAMIERRTYLIIIGKGQVYTEMPEYRHRSNKEYWNERVRGTGGNPTSFGEENLLSLPVDRYDDESIAVHEFAHTIDGALRALDATWNERKRGVYDEAIAKGLYRGAYAATSPGEYWAEIVQSYFDSNRVNNWNHGPVGKREELREYDPAGYELVRSTFRLTPETDWRYSFRQSLPRVSAPPERFGIDPYYKKFTWARELIVLGREASDEALLAANDTIRKLFAYRHDILKALINDGVRVVILGRTERLADLPELRERAPGTIDLGGRTLDYAPGVRRVVIGEEAIVRPESGGSRSEVIRALAVASYRVTSSRPVDPNWDDRPRRQRQQYELNVSRLDRRFGERVAQLHAAAMAERRWRGTPAVHRPETYWAEGVLAYFDAVGRALPPEGSETAIDTREKLRDYDRPLYELVHETMAYAGRVEWRYRG